MQINKSYSLFISALLLMGCLGAQPLSLESNLNSELSSLAREAVREGLYLIAVDYVLVQQETKERFGRDDNAYFNRIYGTAVSVGECLWVNANLVDKPWDGDESFARYRNNASYLPVRTRLAYRHIDSTEFVLLDSVVWNDTITGGDLHLYAMDWQQKDQFSFSASEKENLNGRSLAMYLRPTQNLAVNPETEIKLVLSWTNTSVVNDDKDLLALSKKPSQINELAGGVLFEPITAGGKIVFSVVGLVQDHKEEWTSIRIPFIPPLVSLSTTVPVIEDPVLTPAASDSDPEEDKEDEENEEEGNKRKKRKKNRDNR